MGSENYPIDGKWSSVAMEIILIKNTFLFYFLKINKVIKNSDRTYAYRKTSHNRPGVIMSKAFLGRIFMMKTCILTIECDLILLT